ncbi:MAG TPA: tetratricopeptide repeat protein, partial [Polyangiaceae bacterium]|nr:tetratricopeptide repeat protein [Polyangiaceae bacterium]
NDFSLAALERVTLELVPTVAREELLDSEFVYESDVPGLFRFRHGMSREVVYESIVLPERRRLHAAALAALEEDSANTPEPARPLELLAHHAAGAGEHARAARYAELAGDKAAASSSLDRARQHYRNALEWLDREDLTRERRVRWVGIASKLAAASLYRPSPDMPQFIERMRAHSDYLGNLGDVARADYWLGWFHYAFGDQRAAIARYERALQQAREIGDVRLESQVLLNLGQSFAAASDYDRADEHFSRGLGLKKRASSSSSKPALGVAYSLATRGMMYAEIGQFERAYACAAESIDVVGGTSLPAEAACVASLCLIQMLQGDFRACLDTSARMRVLAARIGAHFIFAQNQVIAGYARWMSEHSREGMAEMLHGMRWMEIHNLLLFGSFSYAHVADALAAVPEPTAARESALRSLERTARGDPGGGVLAHCALGRVADLIGAGAEARAHFDKAFACCRERPSPRALALAQLRWAECHLERGAVTEISRALGEARAAFRSMKMPFYERQAEELSARIGSFSP